MECRCYRGSGDVTRMKQLEYAKRDFVALASNALCLALVIVINIYFPKRSDLITISFSSLKLLLRDFFQKSQIFVFHGIKLQKAATL